ncbi:MAG: PKD domain-containing protein, partial [Candidatus Thermoplasmatota archaeon]|nr:PKD domain-containing protein [Candidatus Thermoplasmatota archaeon]
TYGSIINYTWGFGDGAVDYGKVVPHKYTTPGDYTVTLTVTDDDDSADTFSQVVTVTEKPKKEERPWWLIPGFGVAFLIIASAAILIIALAVGLWLRKKRV